MKKQDTLTVLALVATAALLPAIALGVAAPEQLQQDPPAMEGMPELPPPQEEHKWLQQLVGEWTVESRLETAPGQPPIVCEGTDSVRSLGGRWVIAELASEMPGMGAMNAVLTIGYDPAKGTYVGSWVDSVTNHMWIYKGTLDSTGKILTLEAEGPNMMDPTSDEPVKYRDVIEIKGPDHRVLKSYAQIAEGEWQQFVTADYRRKN